MNGKIRTAMAEFDAKFFCEDDTKLISQLLEDGFELKSKNDEIDIYFTDKDGKFVDERTFLRVRKKENQIIEISYKDKTKGGDELHHLKESNILSKVKSYDETVKFFNILGHSKYITVYKDVEIYTRKYDNVMYNVVVEKVPEIGSFIEFEVISPKSMDKTIVKENFKKFVENYKEYDINKAKRIPRDYVAKKQYCDLTERKNIRGIIFTLNENQRAEDEFKRMVKLGLFRQLADKNIKLALLNKSRKKLDEDLVIKLQNEDVFELILTKVTNEPLDEIYDFLRKEMGLVESETIILEEDSVTCRLDQKQIGCFDSITQIALVILNASRLKDEM